MHRDASLYAYVCAGSNSGDAPEKLAQAREEIAALGHLELTAASSVYLTEPQLDADQPWFHNQALRIWPGPWQPGEFMRALLDIESKLGRRRVGPRYGPRCIDLDLLLFGQYASEDPFCILPHPRLLQRAFALAPLAEIAPGLVIRSQPVEQWLRLLTWRREGQKIYQKFDGG